MGPLHHWRKTNSEDLPVPFQLQPNRGKPLFHILQQLSQLSLIGAEDREVVHLPQIVADAILLVVDHQVQRLEGKVKEPGGEERSDQNAVLHHGIAQPKRFIVLEQPLQCVDDIRRVELLEAMVDVTFQSISSADGVVSHPLLQCLHSIGIASALNARNAVPVHAPHDMRDHRL